MLKPVNIKTKLLRYVGSMSSALANKTETITKWKNENLKDILEVFNKVIAELSETKEFIESSLEQKCLKEKISVEEVICIFISLEAKN